MWYVSKSTFDGDLFCPISRGPLSPGLKRGIQVRSPMEPTAMKPSKFSEERISYALRQHEGKSPSGIEPKERRHREGEWVNRTHDGQENAFDMRGIAEASPCRASETWSAVAAKCSVDDGRPPTIGTVGARS